MSESAAGGDPDDITTAACGLEHEVDVPGEKALQCLEGQPRHLMPVALGQPLRVVEKGLGEPSSFTGGFRLAEEPLVYGPHSAPRGMPMMRHTMEALE